MIQSSLPESRSRIWRTRIKFCGMRRVEDAEEAVRLGVDAIGLVHVAESRRHVDLEMASAIRERLPPFVACVVLLRNPARDDVRAAVRALQPDYLQFHGEEEAAFCRQFGVPYLKAIAMGGDAAPASRLLADYADAAALVLDGHPPGELGGQGRPFDWDAASVDTSRTLILAGGLEPENVGTAIARLQPYAVDVSSGVEAGTPGVKDWGKMAAFVAAVRRADSARMNDSR